MELHKVTLATFREFAQTQEHVKVSEDFPMLFAQPKDDPERLMSLLRRQFPTANLMTLLYYLTFGVNQLVESGFLIPHQDGYWVVME